MQGQKQFKPPIVLQPAQQFTVVKSPAGREYYMDSQGKIIDPTTGMIYDPSKNIITDPTTGITIDANNGMVYDMEGNIIGSVPLSELYGFTTVSSATPQTTKFSTPVQGGKIEGLKKTLGKIGSTVVSTLDKVSERIVMGMPQEKTTTLEERLQVALSRVDKEAEFMRTVLRALIEYVNETGTKGVVANKFITAKFPNADSSTKKKIKELLNYMWKTQVVPPAR